jgi:hypothetical protein
VELPSTIRDELIDELDEWLEAVGEPDVEQVVAYLLEQLEVHGDEHGVDDIVAKLEEEGGLESSLTETLEEEMGSNDEFEFTGEEVVSLLERLTGIEWDEEDEDEDEDGEDDEDDEDDEEEDDED